MNHFEINSPHMASIVDQRDFMILPREHYARMSKDLIKGDLATRRSCYHTHGRAPVCRPFTEQLLDRWTTCGVGIRWIAMWVRDLNRVGTMIDMRRKDAARTLPPRVGPDRVFRSRHPPGW
jgi:hypothetical protein